MNAPSYQIFWIEKVIGGITDNIPIVLIAEPFSFINDIRNMPRTAIPLVLEELEQVRAGEIEQSDQFGGNRLCCWATSDGIVACYDFFEDDLYAEVSLDWMIELLRKWQVFLEAGPPG